MFLIAGCLLAYQSFCVKCRPQVADPGNLLPTQAAVIMGWMRLAVDPLQALYLQCDWLRRLSPAAKQACSEALDQLGLDEQPGLPLPEGILALNAAIPRQASRQCPLCHRGAALAAQQHMCGPAATRQPLTPQCPSQVRQPGLMQQARSWALPQSLCETHMVLQMQRHLPRTAAHGQNILAGVA